MLAQKGIIGMFSLIFFNAFKALEKLEMVIRT